MMIVMIDNSVTEMYFLVMDLFILKNHPFVAVGCYGWVDLLLFSVSRDLLHVSVSGTRLPVVHNLD